MARAPFAALLLVAAMVCAGAAAQAEGALRLLMLEEPGCPWCLAWRREIGPAYPNTAEGRRAPLIRQRIGEPLPEGVALTRPARFTPTFVLLEDGREIGRIEGYPGEEFFWFRLQQLFDAGADGGS